MKTQDFTTREIPCESGLSLSCATEGLTQLSLQKNRVAEWTAYRDENIFFFFASGLFQQLLNDTEVTATIREPP